MKEKLLRMAELIDTLKPDQNLCDLCHNFFDCQEERVIRPYDNDTTPINFCSDFEEK